MFAIGFLIFIFAVGVYAYHDANGTAYRLQDSTMRLITRLMAVGAIAMALSAAVKLWEVMP